MHVILLERIPKLGQMGETVRVRDGYARNYLLPQGKALRSTEENQKRFEAQRAQLEARNLDLKKEAEAVAAKLDGQKIVIIRQAGERGQLYGSVSTRDIAEALGEAGFTTTRSQVELSSPIKEIGVIQVPIRLHPEVEALVAVNVARNVDEAERQARGEDVTAPEEEYEAEEIDAEAFFEDEALAEQAVEGTDDEGEAAEEER